MSTRTLSVLVAVGLLTACERDTVRVSADADARLLELDAPALAAELTSGRTSAERVTQAVLGRIAAIDASGPALNAIIEVNPDALDIARALDRRFAERGPVGPLHGMPVAIKANIDTADSLATSAGSLALRDHYAARDAEIVRRLREAGAVIIAKTNLSEWANIRSNHSTSGWSSLGGQTKNPYVLDRNPCGSSSGSAVAVAARIVPLAVGTETDGSIVCPAGVNGIVGIKPTRGSVSGEGIIPISIVQDTAGPMARTVAGAAMLLDVLREQPITRDAAAVAGSSLAGIRIGVVRDYFGANTNAAVEASFSRALALLEAQGAELVDPIELALPERVGALELDVLLHDFKLGINAYLSRAQRDSGAAQPSIPDSLEALIEFNRRNANRAMPHFGQELFEAAQQLDPLDAPGAYAEAVAGSRGVVEARLASIFETRALDALVAPANGPAWRIDYARGDAVHVSSAAAAALSGYPSLVVPAALIEGLPVGIALTGRPAAEVRLIEMAAVFERARGPLPPPEFVPSRGR